MRRTTEQWEELLDGTADGPWETKRHGNELVVSICTTVHDPQRYVGDIYGEWNARLAAHAPEAVAEVVRLRRRLERMRENYELIATHADHPQALGVVHQINDDLTRILEGGTDE